MIEGFVNANREAIVPLSLPWHGGTDAGSERRDRHRLQRRFDPAACVGRGVKVALRVQQQGLRWLTIQKWASAYTASPRFGTVGRDTSRPMQ